ncbi:lamin tail domain-containing protein, partial [bacterium]|nr:lamin tail domain-containing protein [bacterium]
MNRELVPPSVEVPELSAAEVPPALLMTEFLAANDSGLKDGDDDRTDWIEIHNPGQTPLNLSQFALTQDRQLEELWEFPSFLMGSGDYLIVHASGKNRRSPNEEWHTDFKLNADGEFLAIVMKESRSIVHSFGTRYPQQQDDISYGI